MDNLNVRYAGLVTEDTTGGVGMVLDGRGRELIIAGCASLGSPIPGDNDVVWVNEAGVVCFSTLVLATPRETEGAA